MMYINCPDCSFKVYMSDDGGDCLQCGWSSNFEYEDADISFWSSSLDDDEDANA